MKLSIEPLRAEQVRAFMQWEYAGPYAMYNMSPADEEGEIGFFLDPQNGYFAITDEAGTFLGFCNFGADACVPGGDYTAEAVDIGMGMRPDLTGQGNGAVYAAAVFEFARNHYPDQPQRVTIAEFNERAQQLCRRAGFVQVERFERAKDGRGFVVMVRD